ncbi:hypothetical protein I4U23_000141 [Adineta vaga]|nr:hypothetical protein I4U23_000141 [Adineta vaga]
MLNLSNEDQDLKSNESIRRSIPRLFDNPTIIFLTPNPDDSEWQSSFHRHEANFQSLNINVLSIPWYESPLSIQSSHIYLVNLVWNYHLQTNRWLTWLQSWPETLRLINSVKLLLWNTKKTYLKDLEMKGIPIIPTIFVDHIDETKLIEATGYFNTFDLIIKPQISASSDNIIRVLIGNDDFVSKPKSISINEAIEKLNKIPQIGSMMIQPFMTNISHEGEISVIIFDGQISHVVKKTVHQNDFRVQTKYGGTCVTLDNISSEIQILVDITLKACPEMPIYARIDILRNNITNKLCVVELELIEPGFFLDNSSDGGMAFAKTILKKIKLVDVY